MAKLAILARSIKLHGHWRVQELKIVIEVFYTVFGAKNQDHFFKCKSFYFSLHSIVYYSCYRTLGRALMRLFLEREDWSSNLESVKSSTVVAVTLLFQSMTLRIDATE